MHVHVYINTNSCMQVIQRLLNQKDAAFNFKQLLWTTQTDQRTLPNAHFIHLLISFVAHEEGWRTLLTVSLQQKTFSTLTKPEPVFTSAPITKAKFPVAFLFQGILPFLALPYSFASSPFPLYHTLLKRCRTNTFSLTMSVYQDIQQSNKKYSLPFIKPVYLPYIHFRLAFFFSSKSS